MKGLGKLSSLLKIKRDKKRGRAKLVFLKNRGGMLSGDILNMMKTISIEVRRPLGKANEHSQSYKCKNPVISYGENWYRASGYLESKSMGVIPVKYDILTKYDGLKVWIEFKLLFEESLEQIEMVKAWCWINANNCVVADNENTGIIYLSTDLDQWDCVYNGNLEKIRLINENGSMTLLSKDSNSFIEDRIWKHKEHAEYVTLWFNDNSFPTIEKGTIFKCKWILRYTILRNEVD